MHRHRLFTQVDLEGQAFPHAPQFKESNVRLEHVDEKTPLLICEQDFIPGSQATHMEGVSRSYGTDPEGTH